LSVTELPLTEKYDVCLSNMVLHFLDTPAKRKSVDIMQAITADNGLCVVSAYTIDNPEGEKAQRPYPLLPGELRGYFDKNNWSVRHYREGFGHRAVVRVDNQYLVPHEAEIIAAKSSTVRTVGTFALHGMDAEYWRRADPDYYETLKALGEV
jgi:hypothetical protein